MGEVKIYALCEPDTGEARYIGKARHPKKRFNGHISLANAGTSHPAAVWIRTLAAAGKKPLLTILTVCTDDQADEVERGLIAEYSSRGIVLLNVKHAPVEGGKTTGQVAKQIDIPARHILHILHGNPHLKPIQRYSGVFSWTEEEIQALQSHLHTHKPVRPEGSTSGKK